MAKVQVMIAATSDGFFPSKEDRQLEWLRTDKRGFARWNEASDRRLSTNEPLIDLICEKQRAENTAVYLAEISDEESAGLLRGLFAYHLVDEIILYLLPFTVQSGVRAMEGFAPAEWKTVQVRRYRNGICRVVYRKVLQ